MKSKPVVLRVLTFALLPSGIASAASSNPSWNAATIDAPNAPVIHVNVWFVAFDASMSAADLPFNLAAAQEWIRSEGHAEAYKPDVKGRMPTWGLAQQTLVSEFVVRSQGCELRFVGGALNTTGDHAPWQVLAAPRVTFRPEQTASLSAGQRVPYLAQSDNGCLIVERSEEIVEGATLAMRVGRANAESIRFEEIQLKVSRVIARQEIPGVPFDVGRPIFDSRETQLGLTLDPGKVALIPLPQATGESMILVFLTAEVDQSGAR